MQAASRTGSVDAHNRSGSPWTLQKVTYPVSESVNIHHIDQTNSGPVMEITATEHQQNYSNLHTNTGQEPLQIDRNAFSSWRKEYWQWRSKILHDGGNYELC